MPHSVKEERKGVTLPDLFWSYAIYSSALFDSSWIFIDFPDFCHYTIHFDWKQKNSQLQSEDCTSCFFPSEAPQYLVFLLPLHSCLSSVLIMTPPPPRSLSASPQDFPHISIVTVITSGCNDLQVYFSTGYKIFETTDLMQLTPGTSFMPDISEGLSKSLWNETINQVWLEIMVRTDLSAYNLICFITDFYRCFPLNAMPNYLLMVLGEKSNMKSVEFAKSS